MKKNLMIIVAFVLIFTHIIPPYSIVFANDEVNECGSMDFTVQSIKEGDEKTSGTALPSDQLTIEFKTKSKSETVNVDTNGKFELKFEEDLLELNDEIKISNDYFKIETRVASEESALSLLQSEQYAACPVEEKTSESEDTVTAEPDTEETSDPEDTVTAEPDTEEASDSEDTVTAEPDTEEASDSEDTVTAEPDTEEASDSEDTSTEKTNTEETLDSEDTSTEKSDAEETSDSEDVVTEEPNTEKASGLEKSRKTQTETELFNQDDSTLDFKLQQKLISIQEFSPRYQNVEYISSTTQLTEVQLLKNVIITTKLSELENTNYYNLKLHLNGSGIDVDLINPQKTFVFYMPELAGKLEYSDNGQALVTSQLTPINFNENLPLLTGSLNGLVNSVNGLITGVVNTLDLAINQNILIPDDILSIRGINSYVDEDGVERIGLNQALSNLNNLDENITSILSQYEQEIAYTIDNENGTVVVRVPENLEGYLESVVIGQVQTTLNDVLAAVDNLDIQVGNGTGLVTGLVNGLIRTIVNPLKTGVTDSVAEIQTGLTDGVVDLSGYLANAQVFGETNVTLDVLIDKPSGIEGEVNIKGMGIQGSIIDLALLNSLESQDTITFPDTTVPILKLVRVPNEIQFGNIEIKNEKAIFGRENPDNVIEIKDTRKNDDWVLRAKAPNLSAGNNVLENALIYIRNGEEVPINDTETTVVESTDANVIRGEDSDTITWNNNAGSEDGLLLKVNPLEAVAGEEYSTTIEWTLTDGP